MQTLKAVDEKPPSLVNRLLNECRSMLDYALASGLRIPTSTISRLSILETDSVTPTSAGTSPPPLEIGSLTRLHQDLSKIVAPATPLGIELLARQTRRPWWHMKQDHLIRHLTLLSILSLIAFITLSLSPFIDEQTASKSLFDLNGWQLFFNELFLLSAAALGASFGNLFKANKYYMEGSFDPRYNSSYWIRFQLGLIAGIILAEIISPQMLQNSQSLAKPMLSMLAGFSSDLVFRVLNRLVKTMEALIRGSSEEILKAQKRLAEEKAAQESQQQQLKLALDLIRLKKQLGLKTKPEELEQVIDKMLENLAPEFRTDRAPEGG